MGETFRKNVIIVGAGASKEYGLPTGAELAQSIADLADIRFDDIGRGLASGDHQIVSTLRLLAETQESGSRDINPYLHAAWRIRDNMPLAPSIDNFIDTHRHDKLLVRIGKIAICHAIQMAESQSALRVDQGQREPSIDFRALRGTWLEQLFKILVAQRTFDDFLEALAQITFVSFNYDRCIHQFFYYACSSYFGLGPESYGRLASSLRVLYPYGTIGEFTFSGRYSSFGQVIYKKDLLDASMQIRTFTEGAESNLIQDIRHEIASAEIVMFLGFGFLQLNMDLLFQYQRFGSIKVLGTGKGLSKYSISQLEMELADIFSEEVRTMVPREDFDRIRILNCTCGELFFEFHRYLTRPR